MFRASNLVFDVLVTSLSSLFTYEDRVRTNKHKKKYSKYTKTKKDLRTECVAKQGEQIGLLQPLGRYPLIGLAPLFFTVTYFV